jgi:hypothetical protein
MKQSEGGRGIEQQSCGAGICADLLRHGCGLSRAFIQGFEHAQFNTGQQNLRLAESLGHFPQALALFHKGFVRQIGHCSNVAPLSEYSHRRFDERGWRLHDLLLTKTEKAKQGRPASNRM